MEAPFLYALCEDSSFDYGGRLANSFPLTRIIPHREQEISSIAPLDEVIVPNCARRLKLVQ